MTLWVNFFMLIDALTIGLVPGVRSSVIVHLDRKQSDNTAAAATHLVVFVQQSQLQQRQRHQTFLQGLVEARQNPLSPGCPKACHQSTQCTPATRVT